MCVQSPALLAKKKPNEADMPTMVVIANKIERPIANIAGSVLVIDAAAIEQNIAQNMDEMLRYQPALMLIAPAHGLRRRH